MKMFYNRLEAFSYQRDPSHSIKLQLALLGRESQSERKRDNPSLPASQPALKEAWTCASTKKAMKTRLKRSPVSRLQ